MDLALDLAHVEKRYGKKVHALKGISLRVARGEVFGLLGPNGAGKSTLVKILMRVVKPTRADGFVLGLPVASKASLAKVGYLPENHRFPRYLTGRQTLDFFASLSGAPRDWRKRRVPELLETVGMTAWADRKVGEYSKGMMQRVGIAQALAADPDLVVLDEPTDGVDPVGRRDIRDVLLNLKQQGKTVFINSHLLSELEMVCDRVAIMVSGQVARQGTMSEMAVGRRFFELDTDADPASALTNVSWTAEGTGPAGSGGRGEAGGPPPLPGAAPARVATLASGLKLEARGSTLRAFATDAAEIQPLIDALRASGRTIRRVQLTQPTLEQLFMEAVAEVSGSDKYTAGARI